MIPKQAVEVVAGQPVTTGVASRAPIRPAPVEAASCSNPEASILILDEIRDETLLLVLLGNADVDSAQLEVTVAIIEPVQAIQTTGPDRSFAVLKQHVDGFRESRRIVRQHHAKHGYCLSASLVCQDDSLLGPAARIEVDQAAVSGYPIIAIACFEDVIDV